MLRGQDGRERVSAAVTWQVAQPLWARPPPGLSRGGSACGLARCLANADLLSLRSTKPSTAPCPLHSWPTAPCTQRVPWASDYPRAQLGAAQAREGWGVRGAGSTLAHSGAWRFPARSLPKAPAWSAPLPTLSNRGLRCGGAAWAASCRGRDKSWGTPAGAGEARPVLSGSPRRREQGAGKTPPIADTAGQSV